MADGLTVARSWQRVLATSSNSKANRPKEKMNLEAEINALMAARDKEKAEKVENAG